jgi:hypothetical protein
MKLLVNVIHRLVVYDLLSFSNVLFRPLLSEIMATEEVLIHTDPQKVMWEQGHYLHADTSILRKELEDLPADFPEVHFAVQGC